MKLYELVPTNGRKSFDGKAFVQMEDDGSEILLSYCTPIMKRDTTGKITRLWSGWSATTGRHIKSFCGLTKAEFTALPVVESA